MTLNTPRVHDVIAAAPLRNHLTNQLWWILQIGVDDYDRLAPTVVEARSQRNFLAEVAAETKHPNVAILLLQRTHRLHRAVHTPVIHIQDFVRQSENRKCGSRSRVKFGKHFLFVVGGYDHAQCYGRG